MWLSPPEKRYQQFNFVQQPVIVHVQDAVNVYLKLKELLLETKVGYDRYLLPNCALNSSVLFTNGN